MPLGDMAFSIWYNRQLNKKGISIKNQSIIVESNLSCSDIATKCNANSGHARLKAFLSRKANVDA